MYNLLLTIHVIVCVLVVLVVLIQSGRSGGLSGLMGGGGGDALFSTSGQQSGLRKLTVILACVFMATSLFLTMLKSREVGQSVLNRRMQFPQVPQVDTQETEGTQPQAAPVPKTPQKSAAPAAKEGAAK